MIFLSFADFFSIFLINFQEHNKKTVCKANTSKEIVKITIFKMIILGGISSDLQSEIKFYGATLVEL